MNKGRPERGGKTLGYGGLSLPRKSLPWIPFGCICTFGWLFLLRPALSLKHNFQHNRLWSRQAVHTRCLPAKLYKSLYRFPQMAAAKVAVKEPEPVEVVKAPVPAAGKEKTEVPQASVAALQAAVQKVDINGTKEESPQKETSKKENVKESAKKENGKEVVKKEDLKKEALKKDSIIWTGHEESLKKAVSLLEEFKLPAGLLPLQDVVEIGYVRATGYIWLIQKKKIEHNFKIAGKLVSYATEISGYLEKNRIKKLSGVRARELLIWAPVGDISVDEPSTGKIHFKSFAGITKTFPVEAFAPGQ